MGPRGPLGSQGKNNFAEPAVVSLEIPKIIVSLEISVFLIFLAKISGKIVKICFWTPGTKIEF
mgnify:CR=1 FL=1